MPWSRADYAQVVFRSTRIIFVLDDPPGIDGNIGRHPKKVVQGARRYLLFLSAVVSTQ